jgi:hypothetical protein
VLPPQFFSGAQSWRFFAFSLSLRLSATLRNKIESYLSRKRHHCSLETLQNRVDGASTDRTVEPSQSSYKEHDGSTHLADEQCQICDILISISLNLSNITVWLGCFLCPWLRVGRTLRVASCWPYLYDWRMFTSYYSSTHQPNSINDTLMNVMIRPKKRMLDPLYATKLSRIHITKRFLLARLRTQS